MLQGYDKHVTKHKDTKLLDLFCSYNIFRQKSFGFIHQNLWLISSQERLKHCRDQLGASANDAHLTCEIILREAFLES